MIKFSVLQIEPSPTEHRIAGLNAYTHTVGNRKMSCKDWDKHFLMIVVTTALCFPFLCEQLTCIKFHQQWTSQRLPLMFSECRSGIFSWFCNMSPVLKKPHEAPSWYWEVEDLLEDAFPGCWFLTEITSEEDIATFMPSSNPYNKTSAKQIWQEGSIIPKLFHMISL